MRAPSPLICALCLSLSALLAGAGCNPGNGSASDNGTASASSGISSSSAALPAFNAKRAFADLEKQVAFGPRVPQTPGHAACRDWLLEQLNASTGNMAQRQDFTFRLGGGRTLAMSNVVARFNPEAKKQVLLCAHWDTRPTADMEIDEAKQRKPIAGANDGASGVAVLLELARMFKEKPPTIGVQIVLFDGEDFGPRGDRMYLGAKHYAKNPAFSLPDYAILIDMIGDRELDIYREKNSEMVAPEINDKVWKAAEELGVKAFQFGVRHEIQDDHLPLQEAGVKAIDLIDFDYGHWHTLDDTPDKCSPEALKAVGDVLAKVVYDEK